VFDHLRHGMHLEAEGTLGTFVPREDSERPMIFVAGGPGFAPVKALIEHFLEIGTRRAMTLVWGARAADDLYSRELAAQWAGGAHPVRFLPVVSDPERAAGLPVGLAHEAVLAAHRDLSAFDVYMSGPPALIDAGRHSFVAAGLPEDHLYFDSFDYAPDVLAKILGSRAGIHGL
jgi:CDP-4-dehydro-6-deoxyglucose reductase